MEKKTRVRQNGGKPAKASSGALQEVSDKKGQSDPLTLASPSQQLKSTSSLLVLIQKLGTGTGPPFFLQERFSLSSCPRIY